MTSPANDLWAFLRGDENSYITNDVVTLFFGGSRDGYLTIYNLMYIELYRELFNSGFLASDIVHFFRRNELDLMFHQNKSSSSAYKEYSSNMLLYAIGRTCCEC